MKNVYLFLLIIVMCFSSAAWACRPLTVDDCPAMDQGKFGFEAGISSINISGYDTNIVESTSIKYGIIKNIDIGLDIPYQSFTINGDSNVSGLGDIAFKTKVNFIESTEDSAGFSISAGVKFDNSDADLGLGSGTTDYSINSIITRELNWVSLHFNLGYTLIGQAAGQDTRNVTNYGFAFEAPFMADINLLGEIYGSTNPDPSSNVDPLAVAFGANKEIFSWLIVDCGYSMGLNDAESNNSIMIGLTSEI